MSYPSNWLSQLLAPILRPTARFIVGLIAIPLLRFMRAKLRPNQEWDEEFEKDLEQWTRASLVLFLATKNVEEQIAFWFSQKQIEIDLNSNWYFAAGRILLAIGVIESMPDQQLFSVIHPGPKALRWIPNVGLIENIHRQAWPLLRGLICMHLNRSSPVFAILAVIFPGTSGWIFFFLAITQYLIIGLVTSRDKAVDALSQFDEEVAQRRAALVREFKIKGDAKEASPSSSPIAPESAQAPVVVPDSVPKPQPASTPD
ncbi:DNA topoisomerase I [Planctomicrobium sp. SH661]|uniref:DNA topoisomerase I n=1 Tax=Planctomicrobium sp. SH661 TaxID=3448124 RepID=UPI003F5C9036